MTIYLDHNVFIKFLDGLIDMNAIYPFLIIDEISYDLTKKHLVKHRNYDFTDEEMNYIQSEKDILLRNMLWSKDV